MNEGKTYYRIVYQIANRVREEKIWASTPLEALKKFKQIVPYYVYNKCAIENVDYFELPHEISDYKLCYPPDLKIKKAC